MGFTPSGISSDIIRTIWPIFSTTRTSTLKSLADWQDQAQLVIDVPGLRGTHAQLLVGAGYRTAQAVADADPIALSVGVLKFVTTSEGKRVLREGRPPDIEKIKSWVDVARHAVAA